MTETVSETVRLPAQPEGFFSNASRATGFFFTLGSLLLAAAGAILPGSKDGTGKSTEKKAAGILSIFSGLSFFVKKECSIADESGLLNHLESHADQILSGQISDYPNKPSLTTDQKLRGAADQVGAGFATASYAANTLSGVKRGNTLDVLSGIANVGGFAWHTLKKPEFLPEPVATDTVAQKLTHTARTNPSKAAAVASVVGSLLGIAAGVRDLFKREVPKIGALAQIAAYSSMTAGDSFLWKVSQREHALEHTHAERLCDSALSRLSSRQHLLATPEAHQALSTYLSNASGLRQELLASILETRLASASQSKAA